VPPDGRSAGLRSFNMDANWFQKERLNYGKKMFWRSSFYFLNEINKDIFISSFSLL
jgi:hypothetical protein